MPDDVGASAPTMAERCDLDDFVGHLGKIPQPSGGTVGGDGGAGQTCRDKALLRRFRRRRGPIHVVVDQYPDVPTEALLDCSRCEADFDGLLARERSELASSD